MSSKNTFKHREGAYPMVWRLTEVKAVEMRHSVKNPQKTRTFSTKKKFHEISKKKQQKQCFL